MRKKILLIKLGAIGDIVRTTPLLRALKGEVYWVTRQKGIPVLPDSIDHIIDMSAFEHIIDVVFDQVICLDDEYDAAKIASIVKKRELIGTYLSEKGKISYTKSSAEWFDMGLISVFGKDRADYFKKQNIRSYQEILFSMLGLRFRGEEYMISGKYLQSPKRDKIKVGLETRAGDRWPTKQWDKYHQLAAALSSQGYETKIFHHRESILDYIGDINSCEIVVCGDTLAMHIALALKKQVVALFICTSPTEIYDYGRMQKIISPYLKDAFYAKDYSEKAVNAVSFQKVNEAVIKIAHLFQDKTHLKTADYSY